MKLTLVALAGAVLLAPARGRRPIIALDSGRVVLSKRVAPATRDVAITTLP